MGNNNQEPLSNALGQGLFSADGPLYLWHDFMEIALNRKWDWNGRKPVPQTDFAQPAGVTMADRLQVQRHAAAATAARRASVPFLEGTVPPVDNVHSKGCFDIVQEIAQDDRRPQEWIDSADDWVEPLRQRPDRDPRAIRRCSRRTRAITWLISPVLGNSGFGSPDLRRGDRHAQAGEDARAVGGGGGG